MKLKNFTSEKFACLAEGRPAVFKTYKGACYVRGERD